MKQLVEKKCRFVIYHMHHAFILIRINRHRLQFRHPRPRMRWLYLPLPLFRFRRHLRESERGHSLLVVVFELSVLVTGPLVI